MLLKTVVEIKLAGFKDFYINKIASTPVEVTQLLLQEKFLLLYQSTLLYLNYVNSILWMEELSQIIK